MVLFQHVRALFLPRDVAEVLERGPSFVSAQLCAMIGREHGAVMAPFNASPISRSKKGILTRQDPKSLGSRV